MKTLKFTPHLIPLVLSGEKNSTWRLFDDKDLADGDDIVFLNAKDGKEFAKAKIVMITEKKLGQLTSDDFKGHEKFESTEKMFEAYRGYYDDRVTPDTSVKIVRFQLLQ